MAWYIVVPGAAILFIGGNFALDAFMRWWIKHNKE